MVLCVSIVQAGDHFQALCMEGPFTPDIPGDMTRLGDGLTGVPNRGVVPGLCGSERIWFTGVGWPCPAPVAWGL